MSRSVAFVDDHDSRAVPPGFIDDGDALSVTVGAAGGGMGVADGGVAATFLLQPAKAKAKTHRLKSNRTIF
jgi:hypothetical protein